MSDYMKEAERLLDELRTCTLAEATHYASPDFKRAKASEEAANRARSALLAHIQRGAVPEHSKQDVRCGCCGYMTYHREHMGCIRAAAPVHDQFRDAAKMMAAPAEVPMPKPVAYGFGNTAITGHTNRLMMVRIDIPGGDQYAGAFWLPLVLADETRTYGDACRAAGEAAGYARGVRGERDECAALCRNIYSWPGAYYAGPMDTATLKAAASAIEARSGPKVGKRAALRGEVKP